MSRILWKGLLVSPAVLAASLVVSSTALAAEQPVEIAAAAQANLQLAGAATEAAKPETAKPETAEPVSLASNLTVETIEKESANLYEGFANEPIAPVAEQAKAPSNAVAADLSETKPAVAPANLSAEEPVAKQIPAVAPADLSETQPAVAPANLNAEKAAAQPQQISQSSRSKCPTSSRVKCFRTNQRIHHRRQRQRRCGWPSNLCFATFRRSTHRFGLPSFAVSSRALRVHSWLS